MSKNYDLKSKVYGRISATPPPMIWTAGDFDDFGSKNAVSKVLQRLETAGNIRRIDRGLYYRPRLNKLTGKLTAPDYRAAIDAIARRDNARVIVDGMTAANDLGLSDAVPGRVVVHSDARLKPLHIGNLTIIFRPTSVTKLYWAGRPAMRIIQALHWLKPKLENPHDNQLIRDRIESILSQPKTGAALRKDLSSGFSKLPTWMQEYLKHMLPLRKPARASPKMKTRKKVSGK